MTINKISNRECYSRYLRLFQMQVMGVLEDMEKPAESLSSVFSDALMDMLDLKQKISKQDQASNDETIMALDNVIKQMQDCIVGFQFFDAKRQRLENISDGLSDLSDFLADSNNANKKVSSESLENRIVDQYKMEREHEIYKKFLEENESFDHKCSIKL